MAKRDIIIGGASNYSWNELKYWFNSIRKSGFMGDVILVATNISKEIIDKLTDRGVILSLYGQKQPDGSFKAMSNGAPHIERFFYIWNVLNQLDKNEYRYVITTDTRDVVFQFNPIPWLEKNLTSHKIVCASEGLKYKDEPWGNNNMLQTFGPFFHNIFKEELIYNVGTIAGDFEYVKDLLLMIFQMSINRPIPIVDQAVFNFIIHQQPYKNIILKTSNDSGWACQLGTTIHAINSGKGDIGAIMQQNPTEKVIYNMKYVDTQPSITNDYVSNGLGDIPFIIVHQYDRIDELKEKFKKLYGDE